MRLLLLTVAFVLVQAVWSVEQCIKAKTCNDVFVAKAQRASTDEGLYCVAVREKVDCLRNIQKQCTREQEAWIENEIKTTNEQNPTCGSVTPVSMGLSALSILALVIYRVSKQ